MRDEAEPCLAGMADLRDRFRKGMVLLVLTEWIEVCKTYRIQQGRLSKLCCLLSARGAVEFTLSQMSKELLLWLTETKCP